MIVTPVSETAPDACARIKSLWQTCGADVATMTPAAHDRVVAAVSHLPHMLAFALVAELDSREDSAELFAYAGSGFRDFTRIAASSPEMWRDIALANRQALVNDLARYRSALDAASQLIARGDGDALYDLFERAAAARRRLHDAKH